MAFTQNYDIKFERISSEINKLEKGLSQNSVSSIVQDKEGYLWFGTWDGLNRFDGYNFDALKPDYFNSNMGLSSASIRSLFVDNVGNIWIGTENGLNCYNPKTRIFKNYIHSSALTNTISDNYINCITQDKWGFIWVGTNDGLNKIDVKKGKIKRYFLNPNNANSLSNDNINALLPDADYLWIGTQNGLNKLSLKDEVFSIYYSRNKDINSIASDIINCIYRDKNQVIWIGTSNGLNYYNPLKNNFLLYNFDSHLKQNLKGKNDVRAVLMDKSGILYVGTNGNGLYMINPQKNSFNTFINKPFDLTSLSNDYINCIYEDNSGNIWVGTSWEGLNKIDKQSKKFKHIKNSTNDNKSINNNLIWSIVSDKKGSIWIATNEGVNIYNKKTGLFSVIQHKEDNDNSLGSNKVRMIVMDKIRPDIVWLALLDAGVDKYNIKTGKFQHYRFNPRNINGLSGDRVVSLYEDKFGLIWIGTEFEGLNILNPETGKVEKYKNDAKNPYSISSNTIYPVFEDKNGTVWIGTYRGLNRFDRYNKRFYRYFHNPDDKYSMSSDMIFSIYQDKCGFYWLGTMGGGLNRFNPATGESKYYTEINGLPNDVVYSTIEDKNGDFWLSTNFGISRFNIENETFTNFDVKDGIQSHEFNYGAAYIDEEGLLYFGGMNGFNVFSPEDITISKYIPPIVITSFKLFNNEVPVSLSNGDTLKLNYYENFFSFEFSSLDFTNPSKNKYAYYLENIDKNWIYTNADKRYADYTDVKPGKYILYVKGTNKDGKWNDKGIKIYLEIKPPWYDSVFLKIGVILFIIIIVWLLFYYRIKRLKKNHETERKVLEIQSQLFELEQKSLRLQMNPHFIFNTLNSIQSFVIEKDTDNAIYYLSKFSQLMRTILQNSQQSFVPVKDELKIIKNYLELEKLRYNDIFDFQIDIDKEIDEDFIAIPPMIIQPYIENSIIHGLIHKDSKGFVNLKMKISEDYIYCTIEDNGIGREASSKLKEKLNIAHKSSGMIITQERLNILNRNEKSQVSVKIIDLTDDDGKCSGTRVELYLVYKEI